MNPTPIKPMLGVKADIDKLHFPLYASTKLDGVRAIVKDGVVWSRTGKPIRNEYVQKTFGKFHGLDGELIVGSPTAPDVYRNTVSGVMTKEGTPNVKLYVFDCWDECGGIMNRKAKAHKIVNNSYEHNKSGQIIIIDQNPCKDFEELQQFEELSVLHGFEGVMVRSPHACYKNGRSTVKEEGLLKIKRFSDSEAVVINCIEKFHNANEATLDELGYKTHSTRKENLVGMDTLGSLLVEDPKTHVRFSIGSGFTDIERDTYWTYFETDRTLGTHNILGKIVKYKYFTVGMKDAPRFPIFLGFRDPDDM